MTQAPPDKERGIEMNAQEIIAKARQAAEALAAPEVQTKEMTPVDYVSYAQDQIAKALELPAAKRAPILDVIAEGLTEISKALGNDGGQLMGLPVSGPFPAEGDPVTSETMSVSQTQERGGANPGAFRKSEGDGSEVATVKSVEQKTDWCNDIAARVCEKYPEDSE